MAAQRRLPSKGAIMNLRRLFALGTVALGLIAASGPPAIATHEFEYIPTTTRFFMRNDSTACPGTPFLSQTSAASEPGCGFQGGAPFGELYHNGAPVASTIKTYTTRSDDEPASVPVYLDATKSITGNVTVVATAQTNRMAVGQVRVDTTVRAKTSTGQIVTFGTNSTTKIVDPTNSAQTDFPFTFDPADNLDKVRLDEVTVVVDIRGWHVLTGYHRLNGQSFAEFGTYERRPIQHA